MLTTGSIVRGARDLPRTLHFWRTAPDGRRRETPDDAWAGLVPGADSVVLADPDGRRWCVIDRGPDVPAAFTVPVEWRARHGRAAYHPPMTRLRPVPAPTSPAQTAARVLLAGAMIFAGAGHLTFLRQDFQAQVPVWLPLNRDFVVLASGVVEVGLGAALLLLPRQRITVGWVLAAFFVAVFPGNVSQYLTHQSAFGLDTDGKRLIRLFFQPVLVAWALWSTGAWRRR